MPSLKPVQRKFFEQSAAASANVAAALRELVENIFTRTAMQTALAQWHQPDAAAEIAETVLSAINVKKSPSQRNVATQNVLKAIA